MIDTLTLPINYQSNSYCDCVKTSEWTPGGGLKRVEIIDKFIAKGFGALRQIFSELLIKNIPSNASLATGKVNRLILVYQFNSLLCVVSTVKH